ncbi:maestro heat-like repeat-containing protein family member 7 [Melopsittacus undulatus]|uniref:maestro heat-like repeat-containing protein family member 7 n=1 Tax=Melopsittacus undulatus TaxID=13146 RepID=UPI00146DA756|nr:maestro heat-like repeat-containing protein family member 7 [Melopsittacus undulatus]
MHHRERRKQKQVEERRLELDASPRVLTMKFAVLLFPRERMEMVCVLIEAMKDSSIFDRRVAENILELVLRDPDFWLLEIPSVVRSIHECLRNSSIEEMWRMDELITLMAIKYPRELIVTMVLNVPLRESSDLVMWDMVLSISEPIETLQELLGMIQARKLQQLLPHILGRLWDVTEKLQIKGLLILQNVMKHLSREEASPIAVGLVQDLRPFFDAGCERLRALSIRLVCFLLEMMLGCDWRRIRSKTWDLLLPVFFHLNDKSHSVVKASRKALLAVATLLGWEDLQHLLETKQMWRVMECLVKRSRKRMQACLHHSLQYLRDAQVPLREAAVRFIGLAARPLRGESSGTLEEICRALEMLMEEADPELRSLTAQTLLILRSTPEQQNLGCSLWALWCWERRSFP